MAPPPLPSAFLLLACLCLPLAAGEPEPLPVLSLRASGEVARRVPLPDGSVLIFRNFDTVGQQGYKQETDGSVTSGWLGDWREIGGISISGDWLYVGGRYSVPTSPGSEVRRIRISDGYKDPVPVRTGLAGNIRSIVVDSDWLIVTGGFEDSNVRMFWLGAGTRYSPAPSRDLIDFDNWIGVYKDRVYLIQGSSLMSYALFPGEPRPTQLTFVHRFSIPTGDGYSYPIRAAELIGNTLYVSGHGAAFRFNIDTLTESGPSLAFAAPYTSSWESVTACQNRMWVATGEYSPYRPPSAANPNRPLLYRENDDGVLEDIWPRLGGERFGEIRFVKSDGEGVWVGGNFVERDGGVSLIRINDAGVVDRRETHYGPARLTDFSFLPDGGIVAAGDFILVNGIPRSGLLRLRADDSFDPFWQPACGGAVSCVLLDGDQILAGGWFTTQDAAARSGLAWFSLSGSGATDPAAAPWPHGSVTALHRAADGYCIATSSSLPRGSGRARILKIAQPARDPQPEWAREDHPWPVFSLTGYSNKLLVQQGGLGLDLATGVRAPGYFDTSIRRTPGSAPFSVYHWNAGAKRYTWPRTYEPDPVWSGENLAPPYFIDGGWVYGLIRFSDGRTGPFTRCSLSGTGVRDAAFGVNVSPSEDAVFRKRGEFLYYAGSSGLGKIRLPAAMPGQTIQFPPVPVSAPGTPLALQAVSDSGLPVNFTTLTPVFRFENTLLPLTPGPLTVRASQDGPGYEPAADVERTIQIIPGTRQRWTGPALTIPTQGSASPWPSVLTVEGVPGTTKDICVVLSGLTHKSPRDLTAILENPAGRRLPLLRQSGGNDDLLNNTLVFSTIGLIPAAPLTTALYLPAAGIPTPEIPLPAPLDDTPVWEQSLTGLAGTSPNGDWKLYLFDDDDDKHPPVVTGEWSLLIDTGEVSYDSWLAPFLPPGDDRAPEADPNHDGFPNFAAFALGLPPTDGAAAAAWAAGAIPDARLTGDRASLHFHWRRLLVDDLTVSAEFSDSPSGPWVPGTAGPTTPALDPLFEERTFIDPMPLTAGGPRFGRLRITRAVP